VIAFLLDCARAERASSDVHDLGDRRTLLAESGAAPLDSGDAQVGDSPSDQRWKLGHGRGSDTLWAGWPVVQGSKFIDGATKSVVAPLLFTEVALERDNDGRDVLRATSRSIELDEGGLDLLGVPLSERGLLIKEFNSAVRSGTVGVLDQAVTFLRAAELIDDGLDPHSLVGFRRTKRISNCALAWAAQPGGGPYIRSLVKELEQMLQLRTPFDQGPLGVLLGTRPQQTGFDLAPTPAVLATTLEQERAICSAMTATLTVVTGPPGTGKSQVLANTVAAARARGERVLLASKNNHAVEVVHDRLRSMHPDGVPIRAGNAKFVPVVADDIGSALAKSWPTASGLKAAETRWQATAGLVDRPYARANERIKATSAVFVAQVNLATAKSSVPEGTSVDALLIDRDLLATSIAVSQRKLDAWQIAPARWFWQRRRKRAAERELDESLNTLGAFVGEGAQRSWRTAIAADGPDGALRLAHSILDLLEAEDEVLALKLALSLLPDHEAVDHAITESLAQRREPATELFGALWRDLLRPGAPGLPAARAYSAALGAKTSAGASVASIKPSLPGALETFPVWTVSSLSANRWFPLEPGLFDLVIIDEASQSDLASALPLLYRAKRAMVVGDPHQLTHITNLGAGVEAHIASKHNISEEDRSRYSYRETSLYTLAAGQSASEPVFLDRHFRSHPDVIGFSNLEFYGGRLRIETDPSRFLTGPALRWYDVSGTFETGPGGRSMRNRAEALAVMDALDEILGDLEGTEKTVGIVTPFRPHADLIQDFATKRFRGATVTVHVAHGFQGDERDVMIVSPAVTSGASPGLVRFAANPNLLNVALTRARARTVVVGDRDFCVASGTILARLAAFVDVLPPVAEGA